MIYWIILAGSIISLIFFKKRASFYLYLAFYTFIVGAVLRVVGINDIAEAIMRISFIGWLVGIGLSFKEL